MCFSPGTLIELELLGVLAVFDLKVVDHTEGPDMDPFTTFMVPPRPMINTNLEGESRCPSTCLTRGTRLCLSLSLYPTLRSPPPRTKCSQ